MHRQLCMYWMLCMQLQSPTSWAYYIILYNRVILHITLLMPYCDVYALVLCMCVWGWVGGWVCACVCGCGCVVHVGVRACVCICSQFMKFMKLVITLCINIYNICCCMVMLVVSQTFMQYTYTADPGCNWLHICKILLLIFSMVLMYIMVTVPHWANALVLFVYTCAL